MASQVSQESWDAGSISSLAQKVKDLVLPLRSWLWLGFDPWPKNSIGHGAAKKEKKMTFPLGFCQWGVNINDEHNLWGMPPLPIALCGCGGKPCRWRPHLSNARKPVKDPILNIRELPALLHGQKETSTHVRQVILGSCESNQTSILKDTIP